MYVKIMKKLRPAPDNRISKAPLKERILAKFRTFPRFPTLLRHAMPILLYLVFYFSWFTYLERREIKLDYLIHVRMDDFIPFNKYFVIPYYLWFGYVFFSAVYFLITNSRDFKKLYAFLTTGMTAFLLISTLWPNGHNLRPLVFDDSGFCGQLVRSLYSADTPTNLWPSIHVYNSLGVHFAVMHSEHLRRKHPVRILSGILCLSIILSTMFLKQHSVFDVVLAILFAVVMYYFIYVLDLIQLVVNERIARHQEKRHVRIS